MQWDASLTFTDHHADVDEKFHGEIPAAALSSESAKGTSEGRSN
jgi:hypothetical protein